MKTRAKSLGVRRNTPKNSRNTASWAVKKLERKVKNLQREIGRLKFELNQKDLSYSAGDDPMLFVQQVVANVCGLDDINFFASESRGEAPYAFFRQLAMCLCYDYGLGSSEEIGEYFGGRDHSTVLHARKLIKRQILVSREVENLYLRCCEQLGNISEKTWYYAI